MRARYSKYFLNHVLQLQDELATYYVQECLSENDTVPGIAFKTLFDHRTAVDWIKECVSYDHCGLHHLRCFLNDNTPRTFVLYQMDDHDVIDEAARIIREYNYPIVIRPMFEPPEHQSELIDMIFEVKNSGAAPLTHKAKPPQYYQMGRLHKYAFDDNVVLNVLKIIPNGITGLLNSGVDTVNAVIYDAQYVADKGFGDYLGILKKAGANDIKNIAKGSNDLIQYGPRHVMNSITSLDLKTLKEFFGSALYAENWEAAVQIALGIFITKKPNNILPRSTGASTTRAATTAKAKKSKKAVIKDNPSKKSKPSANDGPKNAKNKSTPTKYTNRKDVKYRSADEVNAEFGPGWKPPYKKGTRVTEYTTKEPEKFTRVHLGEDTRGQWMMRSDAIKGLSPEEIAKKYSLPEVPKYVSEVNVPAGARLRTGKVASNFGGGHGATQYQLLGRIPDSSFGNTRSLR